MTPQPRYKDTGEHSFWGSYIYEKRVPQDHFLRALKELIDWQALGRELITLYAGRGVRGRPPYDPVIVFKMLFLSFLYGCSERDVERWVNDSISAHYFLDLALDQPAPDHSLLTKFKNRLMKDNGAEKWLQDIFDGFLDQARDHGLSFGKIQLVDSVHTQADVNGEKEAARQEKGVSPRDPEARVVDKGTRVVTDADGTRKRKRIRHKGYKTHTSMDAKTRLVTSLVPDYGNSADNKAFAALFAHDRSLNLPTDTYGGDKAYDDTAIFEVIEQAGMHVGIKLRRFRTSKKDPNKERWIEIKESARYRVATKIRGRVEQPYGQAKTTCGFERCRYLGLMRYRIQSYLTFMVVNSKRIVKLLCGITFRKLAKGRRREVFQPVYDTLPWA